MKLNEQRFSLDHGLLLETLAATDNLLILQDVDGVCMGLVRDPLARRIDRAYVEATHRLAGHFYVLTNGEHIGSRGLNAIVDRLFETPGLAAERGFYLPGLAGGGVQWQDRDGRVSHPGVTAAELEFLRAVSAEATRFLGALLAAPPYSLSAQDAQPLIRAAVLDNLVSPTINLNGFYRHFEQRPACYQQLQRDVAGFLRALLQEAAQRQLDDAFFVHYAPNLGSDAGGRERVKFSDGSSAGTTDFQFMLRGAVKEAGVLVILNHHFFRRTGEYPLGEHFNARQAPREQKALLQLARERFNPLQMPRIVGMGDTVSSQVCAVDGRRQQLRGGSDRGFLMLVQALGHAFGTDNAVVYIDSGGGEVHRPGLDAALLRRRMEQPAIAPWPAVKGISDPEDPLTLNFVFPQGAGQYVRFFCELAMRFSARMSAS